jgi:hypothetical protein
MTCDEPRPGDSQLTSPPEGGSWLRERPHIWRRAMNMKQCSGQALNTLRVVVQHKLIGMGP